MTKIDKLEEEVSRAYAHWINQATIDAWDELAEAVNKVNAEKELED